MRRSILAGVFGGKDAEYFWETRFLPHWLPLLLGALFSVAAATLISRGQLIFLVPLAALVPAVILFLRYPFAAVLLWVLVFPFFVQPPFGSGRYLFWLLHRFMIPGALGLVLLSDWLRIHKRPPVHLGRAELAILLFLILLVVNIFLLTANPSRTLTRAYDQLMMPLALYFLVRLSQPTANDWRRLAWVGMVTVIAQSAVGLTSWFAPHLLPEAWLGRAGERTVGTFGNPAVFTSTLILFSLILLHYGLQQTSRLVRIVAVATFSLAYLSVFFSFSRGSWLGATLVLIGMMLLYPRFVLRWSVVAITTAALLVGTLLSSEVYYASERLNDQDTAQGRVLGASTALGMIESKPWFGWGFDNYDVYDEQFKTRALNFATREEQTSHNTFLLITSEMGAVGLLLYLAPTAWLLLLSLHVWRRMPAQGFLSWRLLWLLWLLLLDHFVVSSFMEMIHSNLFGTSIWWMTHGLIASLIFPYVQSCDTGVPRWLARYAPADALRGLP